MKSDILKKIKILYESDDVAVLDKPAGLVVHSDGKTEEPTLADWVLEKWPQTIDVGEPARTPEGKMVPRPGIVHRLDRDTSGAIIITKTPEAFEFIKNQFKEHQINKIYQAIVWGHLKEDKDRIERPIGRSKGDFRKWSAGRFARGDMRDAVTDYKVISRFEVEDKDAGLIGGAKHINIHNTFTHVEIEPKTGRTHQIRVHFHFIHHPIVGDTLYAPNHPLALGFDRQALHASRITFEDPKTGKQEVDAPLPKDFKTALEIPTIQPEVYEPLAQ